MSLSSFVTSRLKTTSSGVTRTSACPVIVMSGGCACCCARAAVAHVISKDKVAAFSKREAFIVNPPVRDTTSLRRRLDFDVGVEVGVGRDALGLHAVELALGLGLARQCVTDRDPSLRGAFDVHARDVVERVLVNECRRAVE